MSWAKLLKWEMCGASRWELCGYDADCNEDLAAEITHKAVNVYDITWWDCPAAPKDKIHHMEYVGTLDEAKAVAYAQVRIG